MSVIERCPLFDCKYCMPVFSVYELGVYMYVPTDMLGREQLPEV